jgi:hypothetical protein
MTSKVTSNLVLLLDYEDILDIFFENIFKQILKDGINETFPVRQLTH